MALVYEARRESLAGVAPRVAIKLILPDYATSDRFQELFINEARLGGVLQHQNLVQIQDFDRDGDRFFLVMEYVEGPTLRRAVSLCAKAGVPVPLSVIAEVGRQACEGLHHAHMARDAQGEPLGLVHRDIKPSNLILTPHGVVKILDFGVSKGRLTRERKGSVKGTWGYMAPEQANGKDVGPTTDIFALGIVLYEMAAGKPMFDSRDQDRIRKLLAKDHPAKLATRLEPAYAPLVSVLVRALQRDPIGRYPDAQAFGRALSDLLSDPVTARQDLMRFYETVQGLKQGRGSRAPPSMPRALELPPERTAWQKVLGGVLVVGLGVGAWWAMTTWLESGLPHLSAVQEAEPLPPAPEAPERSFDEVPGPAAEGAPGEAEPPPPPARSRTRPPPVRTLPAPEGGAVRMPRGIPEQAPTTDAGRGALTEGPTGQLTVEARPPGYEVYVDGRLASRGPLQNAELPVGVHLVTVVAADGRRRSFEVELEDGARIRRVWDFDRGGWRR